MGRIEPSVHRGWGHNTILVLKAFFSDAYNVTVFGAMALLLVAGLKGCVLSHSSQRIEDGVIWETYGFEPLEETPVEWRWYFSHAAACAGADGASYDDVQWGVADSLFMVEGSVRSPLWGYTDTSTGEIVIERGMSPAEARSTVTHELIHFLQPAASHSSWLFTDCLPKMLLLEIVVQ